VVEAVEGWQASEVVAEVRVHGNAYLDDGEVLRLAGVAIGQTLSDEGLAEIERRLKASGRFESVEVRKRFRTLTSTTDVVIVLVVHERPGVTEATPDISPAARPWHRLKSRLMFLPILSYADGYGFTYGGRVSTVDLLGVDERLSVPLTWGGTRRAALEFERTFTAGPLTLVRSSVGIWQRENPHFEIDDQRVEFKARAERHVAGMLRTGIETSRSSVEFGSLNDPLWTVGADAVLDTRGDPTFPRNAVVLSAGWTGLHPRDADRINRYATEARGYLGVIRQVVLAGRVQYVAADATLPPYERLLVGGSDTLRGFRTGTFDGDRSLVASAEIRVPITSVLSGAKLGLTGFYDVGTAYNVDQRLDDAVWHRGAGGGVFLIAPFVKINLDVAHGLKTGDTRVHLSSGFVF
jgi:outer membrane protein assembly factor BamA